MCLLFKADIGETEVKSLYSKDNSAKNANLLTRTACKDKGQGFPTTKNLPVSGLRGHPPVPGSHHVSDGKEGKGHT